MKILLVDFSALYWQNWHVGGTEHVNEAADRTIRQVRRAAEGFDRVAICCDSKRNARKEEDPTYKANREPKPQGAVDLMKDTLKLLRRDYPAFGADGYEGDDIIATLVKYLDGLFVPGDGDLPHEWSKPQVTILGCDKDLWQLLAGESSQRAHVVMQSNQTSELFTVEGLLVKHRITPSQVPEWLALAGDKSDNIVGVEKVGAVTASDLLETYGNIDDLYDALKNRRTEFGNKVKTVTNLLEAEERVRRNLTLTRLRFDAPIDCAKLLGAASPQLKKEPHHVNEPESQSSNPDSVPPPAASQPVAIAPAAAAVAAPASAEAPTRAMVVADEFVASAPPPPVANRMDPHALEPYDLRTAYQLAKHVVASRMFDAYAKPEAAFLTIMAGREFGLGAMASLRSFHVVQGKPTMSAQLMMALCLKSSSCKTFRVCMSECSAEKAVVEVQRKEWDKPERVTWTIADAQAADLGKKDNWKRHPRQMLINRAIAEAARFTFPELMANIYENSEIEAA